MQDNVEERSEGGALTNFHRPRAVMVPPRAPQKFPDNKDDMTVVVCSLTSGGLRVQLGPFQKGTAAEKLKNGICGHPEVAQELSCGQFWDERTVLLPPKQSKEDIAPKPLQMGKGGNLNACRHMGKCFLLSSRVQLARESDVSLFTPDSLLLLHSPSVSIRFPSAPDASHPCAHAWHVTEACRHVPRSLAALSPPFLRRRPPSSPKASPSIRRARSRRPGSCPRTRDPSTWWSTTSRTLSSSPTGAPSNSARTDDAPMLWRNSSPPLSLRSLAVRPGFVTPVGAVFLLACALLRRFSAVSNASPFFPSARGMGAKLVTWRRGDPSETSAPQLPAGERSESIELAQHQQAPFLFNIPEGGRQLALETRLYRAPLFEHPPQQTDFLLIRTHCGRWKLRRVTSTAVAGHEEPFPEGEVPAPLSAPPQTPSSQELVTAQIRAHVQRDMLRKVLRKEPPVASIKELAAVFSGISADYLRGAISEFAGPEGGRQGREKADRYGLLPGWNLDPQEVQRLCTPEMVCALEALLASQRRMELFGLENPSRFINSKTALSTAVSAFRERRDEAEEARTAATAILLEMQIAPWAQTHAFLESADPQNKTFLKLEAKADANSIKSRGYIFCYVKKSAKKGQDKDRPAGPRLPAAKITGTDADLRKLNKHQTRAFLRKFGLTDTEIDSLPRWTRVGMIRTLTAAADASGLIAEKRYLRQTRETQQQSAENQRKSADALYARMVRPQKPGRASARVQPAESCCGRDILFRLTLPRLFSPTARAPFAQSRLLAFGMTDVATAPEDFDDMDNDDEDFEARRSKRGYPRLFVSVR